MSGSRPLPNSAFEPKATDHSEPMTHKQRPLRPGSRVWIAPACVAAYFGLVLVPNVLPGLRGSGLFFAYGLSLVVLVVLLVPVGVWGGVGLLCAWVRARPPRPRHRAYLLVGCVALVSFNLAFSLRDALPRALPAGSHLQRFDRAVWQDPQSVNPVPGDVTPRQKMLADVVKRVLPGRTQADLDEILGPSRETRFKSSSGLRPGLQAGPLRDSYISRPIQKNGYPYAWTRTVDSNGIGLQMVDDMRPSSSVERSRSAPAQPGR